MRIYKVEIEHTRYGVNWDNDTVAAKNFKDAVSKVTKRIKSQERITEVKLLASGR